MIDTSKDGPLSRLLAERRPLVLDGAIGTELERRGVNAALPLWSAAALLTDPAAISAIHRDYVAAGADLLSTTTFRTTARTFRRAGGPDRSAALTALAVQLAREAAAGARDRTVLVAGSMGPLEDCYRPDLVPDDDEIRREQGEHARRLAAEGCDFLFLETFGCIREAHIACEEALSTGKEVLVSVVCRPEGTLYSGETLQAAVDDIAPLGPAGMGINCLQPEYLSAAYRTLRTAVRGRTGTSRMATVVYANVGHPGKETSGRLECRVTPDHYGRWAAGMAKEGADVIGGCCGTTPAHIRAVADALAKFPLRHQEGATA